VLRYARLRDAKLGMQPLDQRAGGLLALAQ
jgi:hypothetical protein